MIYLKSEEEWFARMKLQFENHYVMHLERMLETFREKGKVRDTGSPIHHRQSPQEQLGIAKGKCRRIESLLSSPLPITLKVLKDIIEECIDAANYLLYIASLCSMLYNEAISASEED